MTTGDPTNYTVSTVTNGGGACWHIAGVTCPNCEPRKASTCPHCTPRCPHGYPLDAAPYTPYPYITWTYTSAR
jgi:hypothetical protein